MQVYKLILKILYKNKTAMMIYMGIFLFFAILSSITSSNSEVSTLTSTKIKFAVVNHDQDSELIKGLTSFLNKNAVLVTVSDEKDERQDALFFRKVEYILDIPKGFTEEFLRGENSQINKTTVPDASSAIFMDMLVDKYLNTAKTYLGNTNELSQQELVDSVIKDLSYRTPVVFQNDANIDKTNVNAGRYFNFLTYSQFSILILGICTVMIVFNDPDLKRRSYASPVKIQSINLQLVLACFSFAIISWVITVIPSFFMFKSDILNKMGALLLLSSLLFTLTALCISVLVASFVKSRNAMSAAANVIALGSSFIGGVFVEQSLLGDNVLTLGSFTPTYWYVKAVDSIVGLTHFQYADLKPILGNLLVVLGFGVTSLMISLVYLKRKRQSF